MKKGFYMTLEGPEGCGKTTQIEIIENKLVKRGIDVVTAREPGGTILGKRIRAILLDPESKNLVPKSELLLYCADRAQHYEEKIKPSLDSGKFFLSDRGPDATLLYQGYARGLDLEPIEWLNDFALDKRLPNLTVFITGDPEYFLKRAWRSIGETGDKDTRFEQESIEFHKKTVKAIHELAPTNKRYSIVEDNEGDTEEQVNRRIMNVIYDRLDIF